MCDTFAVGPGLTRYGTWIFAKNSDREPDEAHVVVSVGSAEHEKGSSLPCTYITIPQVRRTHAAVLCKPFWIWGAEMGVNEHGVVIGNEALFMRAKPERSPGLIGMDLVRLGLERSSSAREACDVIIELLGRHGQAGPCGYRDKTFTYMNSFLVMDRSEILVLETCGRDYALRGRKDYAAISNAPTIGSQWDASSLRPGESLRSKRDPVMTFFAGSAWRQRANEDGIAARSGRFTVEDAVELLRSHGGGKGALRFNRDVCMHAAGTIIRRSQTTGSMVVELHPHDRFRILVTASSAPCLSTFKPFLPSSPWEGASRAHASYSEDSFWWSHEPLHLGAMLRPEAFRRAISEDVRKVERSWIEIFPPHSWDDADPSLVRLSHGAFMESGRVDQKWRARMQCVAIKSSLPRGAFIRRLSRRTGVPVGA